LPARGILSVLIEDDPAIADAFLTADSSIASTSNRNHSEADAARTVDARTLVTNAAVAASSSSLPAR
jgi:hypothetical protein